MRSSQSVVLCARSKAKERERRVLSGGKGWLKLIYRPDARPDRSCNGSGFGIFGSHPIFPLSGVFFCILLRLRSSNPETSEPSVCVPLVHLVSAIRDLTSPLALEDRMCSFWVRFAYLCARARALLFAFLLPSLMTAINCIILLFIIIRWRGLLQCWDEWKYTSTSRRRCVKRCNSGGMGQMSRTSGACRPPVQWARAFVDDFYLVDSKWHIITRW